MITLSAIANSALRALSSYSVAINVTNTNISNSATDGYSRQRAVLEADGGSVDVETVKRIYSSFLTARLREETQEMGFYEAEQESLASIEVIFNESDASGLTSALGDFWNSWTDLTSDPSDASTRSVLLAAADTLADTFNSISSDLSDAQSALENSVTDSVDTIHALVEQVAALNSTIAQRDASGGDSNTARDSLDALVTKLSELVGISTYTDDTGQIHISLENGKPLVDGTLTWSLSTQTNTSTGLQDVVWLSQDGTATVVTEDLSTGKLGGYLDCRDHLIPAYRDQLNELAACVIDAVNALHESGYNLDGETGVGFFSGADASDMAVNTYVLDDAAKIAAASTADTLPGDGSIALAMADLQNSLLLDSGTSTIGDYFAALVSDVGAKVSSIEAKYEAQESVVASCQSSRDSVSSVNVEEELVSLMLYQTAYEAAANLMSKVDEMMQTIINM